MKRVARTSTLVEDHQTLRNDTVLLFARQMANMLPVARAVCRGALLRNESRGAHYKPDFPNRDDANFMKTTLAKWSPDGPKIDYEPVECKWVKPRPRKYD